MIGEMSVLFERREGESRFGNLKAKKGFAKQVELDVNVDKGFSRPIVTTKRKDLRFQLMCRLAFQIAEMQSHQAFSL